MTIPPTPTPTSDLTSFLGSSPGLNRIYDNVQAQVPAVILSLVKLEAWNTIEDFYIQSTFRRELVSWQMGIGVQAVDFNPYDENWLVAWVLQVQGLHRYKIDVPGRMTDLENPSGVRNGDALLALKPVSYSAALPDDLFQQWFECILDGVLHRLYRMPAKPYSSPQLAAWHGARYRMGCTRARAIAQAGYTNGAGRWNFPYFASGRRKN